MPVEIEKEKRRLLLKELDSIQPAAPDQLVGSRPGSGENPNLKPAGKPTPVFTGGEGVRLREAGKPTPVSRGGEPVTLRPLKGEAGINLKPAGKPTPVFTGGEGARLRRAGEPTRTSTGGESINAVPVGNSTRVPQKEGDAAREQRKRDIEAMRRLSHNERKQKE